jgi:hypothetical protein
MERPQTVFADHPFGKTAPSGGPAAPTAFAVWRRLVRVGFRSLWPTNHRQNGLKLDR